MMLKARSDQILASGDLLPGPGGNDLMDFGRSATVKVGGNWDDCVLKL